MYRYGIAIVMGRSNGSTGGHGPILLLHSLILGIDGDRLSRL